MRYRLAKLFAAASLLLALWGLSVLRRSDPRVWVHPVSAKPGPVRILRFYASAGTIVPGEKAQLCYGVENAKAVRISPMLQGVYPAHSHCLEIVPEHTTHYTLQAEGFDGTVAIRSFTLAVQDVPARAPENLNYAVSFQPSAFPGIYPSTRPHCGRTAFHGPSCWIIETSWTSA